MHPARWLMIALMLAGCLAVPAAAETPRQMAMRGMTMIAEDIDDEQRDYDGWQLVARGIGEMLLAEGLWEAEDQQLRAGIADFMVSCADEADYPTFEPPTEYIKEQTDFSFPIIMREPAVHARRDECGRIVALLIYVPHSRGWGPHYHDWAKLLIARDGDRVVTGGWQQYVGREPDEPRVDGTADDNWLVWREGDKLRAAFAGGWRFGVTGVSHFPVGVLLENVGDRWRVLDYAGSNPSAAWALHNDEAHRQNAGRFRFSGSYGLHDVNGDGVPEITGGYDFGEWAGDLKYPNRDYVIYKVIGRRLRKVWYAKLETLDAVVLRLNEAVECGSVPMVKHVCSSPRVLADVRRLGLFESYEPDTWWFRFTSRERERGSGLARVQMGDSLYEFRLVELRKRHWRISAIERIGPAPPDDFG